MRKNSHPQPYSSSPRVTTEAKLDVYLLLISDVSDTDIETKAGRSHQPEEVRMQLLVLIRSGSSSLHSAKPREGAWKSLQTAGQLESFNEERQPSLPHVGAKPSPAVEGGAKSTTTG